MKKILLLFFAFIFFIPAQVSAQTPTLGFFAPTPSWPHPFKFPCNRDTDNDPEFHPLRPYPGNPCDPLIPRKTPEAPSSSNPYKSFLTYDCAKSMNVSGTINVKDVIDICTADVLTHLATAPNYPLNLVYDPVTHASPIYRCEDTGGDVCQVRIISWAVSIDLSSANLPVMGNTQVDMPDAAKVNTGIDWYLNGTIYQSEKNPLIPQTPSDINRIVNYSGPINKLMPIDLRDIGKLDVSTTEFGRGSQYHDYLVACQKNINDLAYWQNALGKALEAIFTNILDGLQMAITLLHWGIDNLGHLGRALIRLAQLPMDQRDDDHLRAILVDEALDAGSDSLQRIKEILLLGNDIVTKLGVAIEAFRLDRAENCLTSTTRWRLHGVNSDPQPWIMRYVPYATLEDVTGEITVSAITEPGAQPVSPEIDGTIIRIGLSIGAPSDSRLYFPHMKSAIALTTLLNSFHSHVYSLVCDKPVDAAYVLRVLIYTFATTIGNAGDAIQVANLLLSQGLNNLAHMGYALVQIARLPSDQFDAAHISQILVAEQLSAAQSLIDGILSHAQNVIARYGAVAQSLEDSLKKSCLSTSTIFPTPSPPFSFSPTWASQQVTLHQGVNGDDNTLIQGEDRLHPRPGAPVLTNLTTAGQNEINALYSGGRLIRNTEVIENSAAPGPLFVPVPESYRCDPGKPTNTTPGDSLLGQVVRGTLTYYQVFRWTPLRDVACNNCPAGTTIQQPNTLDHPGCIGVACAKEGQSCDDNWHSSGNGCCYDKCDYITACYYAGGACVGSTQCSGENAPLSQSECSNHSNPGDCCMNNYGAGSSSDVCCARHRDNRTTYSCGGNSSAPYPYLCSIMGINCGAYGDSSSCSGAAYDCCSWNPSTDYGTPLSSRPLPNCPMWPTRDLKSAARVNPFTKTPLVEKLYDLLVVNPQSLLRRWLPLLPLSPTDSNSIKETKDETIRAETAVSYSASTNDLQNTRTTAGQNSMASLFFPHFGSLSDYLLGTRTKENYNLQRILRPKNFVGPPDVNINCDASLVDALKSYTPAEAACGVCGSNLGPLAQAIIAKAGELFSVPGGAIWATMLHEGADRVAFYGQFTDDNVYKWSLPIWCPGYEPMPTCDNDAEVTQPPTGWIKYWFYQSSNGPWSAVQKYDPARDSPDKVSRCNFMDGVFGLAKALQMGTAFVSPACVQKCASCAGSAYCCGGNPPVYPMLTKSYYPANCSWTDQEFAQSQVSYAGQCPEPPFNVYEALPDYIATGIGHFHSYSCYSPSRGF